MRRLMFDGQIDNIINSGVEMKGLDFLDNQPSIDSFSVTDQFSSNEIYQF